MGHQEDLQELFGLTTVTYKANLSKDELFDEAIAHDRGRVEEGGPDDAQKAFPTKLGKDGPLIFYTDPSCTGRPVQDTFGVAWPEFEEKVWWKPDFQKFPAEKFEPLMRRVGEYLNARSASLYVKDVYAGSDPEYAVPYRFVGEFASHALFVHNMFPKGIEGVSDEADKRWTLLNGPSFTTDPDRDGTRAERAAGVALICRQMNAQGLTSVHQASTGSAAFTAYQDAREAGDLTFRMHALASGGSFPSLNGGGIRTGFGDEWLRIGAVKYVADGSASERTMAMSTAYAGRPDDFGIMTMTQEQVHEVVEEAHRSGWQVAIHANGDVTIDMVLNAYERVQREWPRADARHRIEHCSLVNPSLLQRIADGGVIPAPFYTYAHYHGEKWIEYGEEKMEWMFAHKSFLDYGIPVAPASDHSPGPYEPLMAIQSMVTRKDFSGRVWGPSQRITVDQALKVCTVNGAYASFEENEKGTITAGKLGDFVILAEDPHDVDPDRIKEIQVVRTVVGGTTMHEA